MTIQALAGLAVLNFLYLVTGAALLWLVRGLDTWTTLLRLAGLAYLIGLAFVGGVWTLLLVVGVPFGLGAVIAV
ncbi:MAG TPA: hypothetical protein VFU99_04155, partial [Gaiellaceae bacterium]|nr:hypothetical protein [Gaiellaceae bacterium]